MVLSELNILLFCHSAILLFPVKSYPSSVMIILTITMQLRKPYETPYPADLLQIKEHCPSCNHHRRHMNKRTNSHNTQLKDIIVIGGSAGSLDPLKEILSTLPATLQAAVFVVVHMSPDVP